MVCELDWSTIQPRFEDIRDARVNLSPPRHHEVFVDGLAGQRMPESIPSGPTVLLFDQLGADTGFERGQGGGLVDLGDLRKRRKIERAAEHRSRGEDRDILPG